MTNDADFDAWVDAFTADWVRSRPQLATMAQYFSGSEQDALDRQLSLTDPYGGSYGAGIAAAQAALARRGLDEFARFSLADLTPAQRTSAAIIQWNLKDAIANVEFARHRSIFDQFVGLHVTLVQFLTSSASHSKRTRCRKLSRPAGAGRAASARRHRRSEGRRCRGHRSAAFHSGTHHRATRRSHGCSGAGSRARHVARAAARRVTRRHAGARRRTGCRSERRGSRSRSPGARAGARPAGRASARCGRSGRRVASSER